MANDKQVTRDIARSKEIFLREPPGFTSGPPKLYNVEEEFTKSASNRSPVVVLVVLSFLVVFGAVAVALTYFIDRATRNVTIGIEEFQDINLTDILDSQKRNETALRAAQRELDDLNAALAEEIRQVEDDADQRVELAANEAVPQADRDRKIRAIRSAESGEINRLRGVARPAIQAKEKEIADLQAQIDAYDSRMLDQAKKSQEALSNQQKLFDAQRDQLTTYYGDKIAEVERQRVAERRELTNQKDSLSALLKRNHAEEIAALTRKFNPTFTEQRALDALARVVAAPRGNPDQLPAYRAVLGTEGVVTRDRFEQARTYLEDLRVILRRLQEIPYINSVPGALKRLQEIERTLVTEYETIWVKLATVLETRNADLASARRTIQEQEASLAARSSQIEQITYALDSHTRSSRENGYILDPRSTTRMTVYINPGIPVTDGATGYVFRDEDEPVATVTFRRTGELITARLESLTEPGKPVQPFDKILVQLE